MVDRIKRILEYSQMSTSAFADKIDISRSSLAHIFAGRNQPSLDVAKKILVAFPEISTEWLIMGMGNMLQSVPVQSVAQASATVPSDAPSPTQFDLFAGASESDTEDKSATPLDSNSMESVDNENINSSEASVLTQDLVQKPQIRAKVRASETNISARESKRDRNINSRGDKKVVQIVFFYEDRSFEVYTPSR
ncbi:MAG: helix-turn-helix transcriptional regulator [Bacteroidales bacterium]|nr:helix-turn-helix transcriptional regulator [Bacteroidales bacterium]